MARAARQGGIVAAYLWEMPVVWSSCGDFGPPPPNCISCRCSSLAQERTRNSIGTSVGLSDLFARAGLHEVEPTAIEIPTIFRNFDDYWVPFLVRVAVPHRRIWPDLPRTAGAYCASD